MNHASPDRRLSDMVYEQLLALLGSEGFEIHARLPGEIELARRFSVSRPVLRQALARLRAEGRISARKGSGNYVEALKPQAEIVEFGALSSIADIKAFLEFRCATEGEIAARAAARGDAAAIAEVERRHAEFERALQAGNPGIDEDIAFHAAVAQACGNRFFAMTITALAAQTRFSIDLVRQLSGPVPAERRQRVVAEHHAIVQAIAAGDAAAARAAMVAHLQGGIARLFGQ
ncbi:GntR family transcriptional regulator [Bordetella genomosp. 1]|uniref:GntR family transcriptional regulator n=1 Tax=Bordetella genomosp. 1 TaxID=1395607 RepID=A0A261RUC4_9BORD|nr:FCD domain-containing protein [Bordetella genomosp. 1]OZI28678.1 GntR family transcriptional regulator [Bordetella genomosp. 1]